MKSALPKLPTSLSLRPTKSRRARRSRLGATTVAPTARATSMRIRSAILAMANGAPAAPLRASPTGWLPTPFSLRLNPPTFTIASSLMVQRASAARTFLSRLIRPRKQAGRLSSNSRPPRTPSTSARAAFSRSLAQPKRTAFPSAFPKPLRQTPSASRASSSSPRQAMTRARSRPTTS